MKKFNKYISFGVASMMCVGLATSCDTSKDNDFVSEYTGAPGIYFSTTENTYLELVEGQSSVSLPVYRDVAGEAVTVGITVTPMDDYDVTDIYTFPSSVTFASGSKEAELVIGYDFSKAELGDEQQYEITLDATPNPFSANSTVVTLVNPAPWNYLGVGEYYDYYWGISNDSYGPAQVTVWQQGLDENLFRVSNPYVALNGDDSYFEFRVLQPGQNFLGVNITQSDLVGWTMVKCEYYPDYSDDMYFVFPGIFQGYDDEQAWVYNQVVDYQDNGLPGYIQLAGFYYMFEAGAGANYYNNPSVEIIFPGYEVMDTSVAMTYEGILRDSSQQESVLINVELGADIAEARAAVMPGTSSAALVDAIVNGSVEYTTFSASGNVKVPFSNNTGTGNYTVAVVVYADGEAKNYDAVTFLYVSSESNYDPNEGWESLGYIEYTDAFVCARTFMSNPPYSYYIEIQENMETPGLYRLVNPYGPGSIWDDSDYNAFTAQYILVDTTDPTRVTMPASDQYFVVPYEDGSTDILGGVWCMADYFLYNGYTEDQVAAEGLFGTLSGGKITFPAFSLLAYWEYSDDDEDTGYFQANFVLDWDLYQATNGQSYLMTNAQGETIAPFYLDLNTIVSEKPAPSVSLTSKPMSLPKSQSIRGTRTVKRSELKKNQVQRTRNQKFNSDTFRNYQKR